MAANDENIVSQPPLMVPITDKNGMLSKAWSIWFRDIYRRTSYKGGNAIDDNKNEIDDAIIDIDATLEEVIEQVLINVNNISDNNDAIIQNSDDIQANTDEIVLVRDEAEKSDIRTFGVAIPLVYDSGANYVLGNTVVYPELEPNRFYQCIESTTGAFDSSKWIEKSLLSSLNLDTFLQIGTVKSAYFQFTGRNTNGPATFLNDFNLDFLNRTAVGVYEGKAKQATFYGQNVFDTANPSISYDFTVTASTEAYHVDFTASTTGDFTISIYEWVQGAGNKIELVPYDPIQAGDLVFVTVLCDLGNGMIPPP